MKYIHLIIEQLVEQILEIKLKAFAEVGGISGFLLSFFIKHDIPFLDVVASNWISQKLAEGVINGIGGTIGAIIFAWLLKLIRKAYLYIKDNINGKRSTTP